MNKSNIAFLAACLTAVASNAPGQPFQLTPLATFGTNGDGSIRAGEQSYLTSDGGFQRGLAYNPATDHLLLVNRSPVGAESVQIIDGTHGTNVGTLDLSSLTLGGNPSFVVNLIGVADDGAIYVGNLSSANSPPEFRLYRWENEAAPQTLVFFGDPSHGDPDTANRRWGDTLSVRGAGTNTQVLIASRGRTVAILQPAEETMATFSSTVLTNGVLPSGALGFGLTFGASNTFWGKSASAGGEALYLMSFDLVAGTTTALRTNALSEFPGRVGPIFALPASNLLVGVEVVPGDDNTRLYDISNVTIPPALLDRKTFFATNGNAIFAGACAIGDDRVYVLDSDNGLVAYSLVASNSPLSPSIFLQPRNFTVAPGTNVTFTAAADGTLPLSFQWQTYSTNLPGATTPSLTLTNVQLADSGKTIRIVVTNDFGAVTSSVATLLVTTNLPVVIPGYEPFNYAAGERLGTNGGWIIQSGTTTGIIEAGNLVSDDLRAPAGNRYAYGTGNAPSGLSHRLLFSESFTSGSVYYSLLLRVDDVAGLTGVGVPAGFSEGGGTLFAKLNMQASGGGYQLGCSIRGSPNTYDTSQTYAVGQTLFVVERYTFNPGSANDVLDLWVNPDPSTFETDTPPAVTINVTGTAGDLASIDRFFLRNVSGAIPGRIVVDELRIGTTWASVTPRAVPQLAITAALPNVMVSWPTNAPDFQLQSASSLSSPVWTDVTNTPVNSGSDRAVTLDAAGTKYFRLIK